MSALINSLAVLKANWDRGQDYIDLFVPFVADCLRRAATDEVSLSDVRECVRQTFGLNIPRAALNTILGRATKRGYVTKIRGVWRRKSKALESIALQRAMADAARRYNALLDRFITYCAERHSVRLSTEDAESALEEYLYERAAPVLAAIVEGTPIPPPERTLKGGKYLVNDFVDHLFRTDPDGFELLESAVKGSMLANVLVFPELGSVRRRFERISAYLDTPLVLRALGCEGPEREAAAREVLDLLFEQGVKLRLFEHTWDEIRGVLDAVAHALRAGFRSPLAHGPAVEYAFQSGQTASDIDLLAASLSSRLAKWRVEVRARPPVSAQLSVDESELAELMKREIRYRNEDQLRHDLECLTAIYRLREGRVPRDLESCGAIFVSTNQGLARVGATVLMRDSEEQGGVPLCVLDTVLATLAWLKRPTDRPEFPAKIMIANCYAALQPPEELWKAYLEEIRRLEERGEISYEEYVQLRVSTVAKKELMVRALGGAAALTGDGIREVVRASREAIVAEYRRELNHERVARREAEERLRRVKEEFEARERGQFERIRLIARRLARVCAWASVAGLYVVVGVALLALNVGYLDLPRRVRSIVSVALVLLTLLGSWGWNAWHLHRWLEARVAGSMERFLWRILGLRDG